MSHKVPQITTGAATDSHRNDPPLGDTSKIIQVPRTSALARHTQTQWRNWRTSLSRAIGWQMPLVGLLTPIALLRQGFISLQGV
jgi:hypothetical protein